MTKCATQEKRFGSHYNGWTGIVRDGVCLQPHLQRGGQETICQFFDFSTQGDFGQPCRWHRAGPVEGACDLPTDGSGRVGVVPQVHSSQDRIAIVVRERKTPEGGLKTVDYIAI